jgi:hypothetical protein
VAGPISTPRNNHRREAPSFEPRKQLVTGSRGSRLRKEHQKRRGEGTETDADGKKQSRMGFLACSQIKAAQALHGPPPPPPKIPPTKNSPRIKSTAPHEIRTRRTERGLANSPRRRSGDAALLNPGAQFESSPRQR